jgi:hypothetical protein
MSTEELVAFPADGIDRWLIRGELHERHSKHRTPHTSLAITNVGCALSTWARTNESSRGVVLIDAYHRIARDRDTLLASMCQ